MKEKKPSEEQNFLKELTYKSFENNLIDIYKKRAFDFVEKAKMIDYMMKHRKMPIEKIAKQMGVEKSELYRIRSILKANDKIFSYVLDGKISSERVSEIIFRLKDKDLEKVEDIVREVVDKKLKTNEMEHLIAEKNNPVTIGNHLKVMLLEANRQLSSFLSNPDRLKAIDVKKKFEIVKEINQINEKLEELKKKLKWP